MKRIAAISLVFLLGASNVPPAGRVEFTPYQDAKPILDQLQEILPAALRDVSPDGRERAWNDWVVKRDAEIRARLAQGDADSIVNFLMFGTSFTAAPRLTAADVRQLAGGASRNPDATADSPSRALLQRRETDLLKGLQTAGGNERLEFARRTIEIAGIRLNAADGNERAKSYLDANIGRVLREQVGYEEAMKEAKSLNDATEEFAEVSKLFKDRGLSLDTSLPPNFAIEETLREMKQSGQLKSGSVSKIGVIGPGLDFTDKHEGYDFYPVQTVQPFAVADSLLRLGLASKQGIDIDILDLSPRVLRHVKRLASNARQGKPYKIELAMDPKLDWQPGLAQYWRQFGNQIGESTNSARVPAALHGVAMRGVAVRPEFARRMNAYDLNVVLQRLSSDTHSGKYDLLIATNILVYYDTFEQSLAMTNIAAMLKPGGYLLTNNLLLELPSSTLRSQGHTSIKYSNRKEDAGDTIIRYRR